MKILFVHQGLISFIAKDLGTLRLKHDVKEICFRGIKDIPAVWEGTAWCDVTFSWFGKLHAFFTVLFSKLLSKKTIVVAGGDDVAYDPEINYGLYCSWWKKWCSLFVFRYADLILNVSEFNRGETIRNAGVDSNKVKLLYHGFDDQKWRKMDGISKECLVLTVGRVTDETFRKKGLELFVRSAAYLPDVPYILVGPWEDRAIDRLKVITPSNVVFAGGRYGENLVQMYSRAKVYVQVSRHESFGCSLAEAMLCECIPVVSSRAAIPEVVGDCGFYVDTLEPEAISQKIKEALDAPIELGKKARERIITHFPLERRRKALLELLGLIAKS